MKEETNKHKTKTNQKHRYYCIICLIILFLFCFVFVFVFVLFFCFYFFFLSKALEGLHLQVHKETITKNNVNNYHYGLRFHMYIRIMAANQNIFTLKNFCLNSIKLIKQIIGSHFSSEKQVFLY